MARDSSEAAGQKHALFILGLLWLAGMGFVGAAAIMVNAGGILFVGGLIAALAPDVFLLGLVLFAVGFLWILTSRWMVLVPASIAIGIVLGLNTRLPEAWRDLRTDWYSVTVSQRFSGQAGQPLQVPLTSLALTARTFAYASVRQDCRGDGCFLTEGFRTLYPDLPREYWKESPASAVLGYGFTLAQEQEQAPTLLVATTQEADLLVVAMELRAVDGKTLANGIARYRSGFAGEPVDEDNPERLGSARRLSWQYLLHANVVNRTLGPKLAPTVSYPVQAFLQRAAVLVHPQDSSFAATAIALQTVSSERFDPPRVVHGGGEQSERSLLFFDKERSDRCRSVLRAESNAPALQTWWLFVSDPTGQHKARVTGPQLCDLDAVWFFDYASMRGHAILTKFDLQGNLLYKISFVRPSDQVAIREPSLHAKDGTIEFEWWTGDNSGSDFRVTAIDKVQGSEPHQ